MQWGPPIDVSDVRDGAAPQKLEELVVPPEMGCIAKKFGLLFGVHLSMMPIECFPFKLDFALAMFDFPSMFEKIAFVKLMSPGASVGACIGMPSDMRGLEQSLGEEGFELLARPDCWSPGPEWVVMASFRGGSQLHFSQAASCALESLARSGLLLAGPVALGGQSWGWMGSIPMLSFEACLSEAGLADWLDCALERLALGELSMGSSSASPYSTARAL